MVNHLGWPELQVEVVLCRAWTLEPRSTSWITWASALTLVCWSQGFPCGRPGFQVVEVSQDQDSGTQITCQVDLGSCPDFPVAIILPSGCFPGTWLHSHPLSPGSTPVPITVAGTSSMHSVCSSTSCAQCSAWNAELCAESGQYYESRGTLQSS